MLHHLKNLTVYFSLIVAGRTSLASACSGVNLFGHCIGFNFAQVYLYGKGLEGTIPADIGKLKDKMLNVWLDGNAITGTIPPQLGQLKKLESLSLNNNKITGTIPPEIGQLKKLEYLRVPPAPAAARRGARPPLGVAGISTTTRSTARSRSSFATSGSVPPSAATTSSRRAARKIAATSTTARRASRAPRPSTS